MYRTDLSDEQFDLIRPHLPPQKTNKRGRPRQPDRAVLNGIFWRLDNGAKWRAVPRQYGKWSTIYARFRLWTERGIWAKIVAALQAGARKEDRISFDFAALDSTIVRAHRCAAGAPKKRRRHRRGKP
jgi:transposase